MTSLLCPHCLPANRAFQNWKSGWRTLRSFDLAKGVLRQIAKFARCPFATTANCSNSFCQFHFISSVIRPHATAFDLFFPHFDDTALCIYKTITEQTTAKSYLFVKYSLHASIVYTNRRFAAKDAQGIANALSNKLSYVISGVFIWYYRSS
jgi:hypothetical protein